MEVKDCYGGPDMGVKDFGLTCGGPEMCVNGLGRVWRESWN